MKHVVALMLFLMGSSFILAADNKIEIISMIKIIGNPPKYDGKKIGITGYLAGDKESLHLFLSKEHADNFACENSIKITLIDKKISDDQLKKLLNHWVFMQCTFMDTRDEGGSDVSAGHVVLFYIGSPK